MNSAKTLSSKCQLTAIVISLAVILTMSALVTRKATAQTTHEVKIADFAFVPQDLTISPGDAVIWNNTDPVVHTLWFVFIANGSTYLLSDPIAPNTTWTHTFSELVELQYYSFDRFWMTGFITVSGEIHDVAVISVTTSKDGCIPMATVSKGFTANVTVIVENQGGSVETFNVTSYANLTAIGEHQVTLNPGEDKILTFSWNTVDFAYGNYTMWAYAWPVEDEADTVDNTLVNDVAKVVIPGDINGDGIVDVFDAVILAGAAGSTPGSLLWNPNADLNGDGIVDVFDAVILAGHAGEHYP